MEIEQLRKVLRYVIFIPLVGFLLYSAYYSLSVSATHNDCGVIKSKSADDLIIRHGHRTELYLNIEFDKKGFYAKEVEPTTYYKYNVGDRI